MVVLGGGVPYERGTPVRPHFSPIIPNPIPYPQFTIDYLQPPEFQPRNPDF